MSVADEADRPVQVGSPGGFPRGFIWGASTAAYQIEGAALIDGRGPSIWDTFSRTPGSIVDDDNGDLAADHYHRWQEDIEHIRRLGLDAYRFSISWSRVQPLGSGEFNRAGILFYKALVDALVHAHVQPLVTLYHWDLPQALQDEGGWSNRETAFHFARYAERMAQELGDAVALWTTLNEPWCSAYLGYAAGTHAPGLTDDVAALRAVHHLNLAHGLAGQAIAAVLGPQAAVSVTLNIHVTEPDDPESADDRAAARQIDLIGNEAFLTPMLEGRYPPELLRNTAQVSDWSFVQAGDLQLVQTPLSILGVNYYFSNRVRRSLIHQHAQPAGGHRPAQRGPWVGCSDVEFLTPAGPLTAMGWNIDPPALTKLLIGLHQRFPAMPLMLTENGAAFDDQVDDHRFVHDPDRVDYLRRHIDAAAAAIAQGVDLRGYILWSLLDNFEWAFGYSKRFGIIFVDYLTGERVWKDSAYWYQDVIAAHRGSS